MSDKMTKVPKITVFGFDLYVKSDEEQAVLVGEFLAGQEETIRKLMEKNREKTRRWIFEK